MPAEELVLYDAFTVCAVFFFALTGALAARRLGYDFIGVFVVAFASGLGGGLIRDVLLRGSGPILALTNWRLMAAVMLATFCGLFNFSAKLANFSRVVAGLDAIGLAAFAITGANKALRTDLHWTAAVFVGMVTAVGGGLLRDVITRTEPLLLKPGQFYALAALFGSGLYVVLLEGGFLPGLPSAIIAILATVIFRILAIIFNWRTGPVAPAATDA